MTSQIFRQGGSTVACRWLGTWNVPGRHDCWVVRLSGRTWAGPPAWIRMNWTSYSVSQIPNFFSLYPPVTHPKLSVSAFCKFREQEKVAFDGWSPRNFPGEGSVSGRWSFIIKLWIPLECTSAFGVRWESASVFFQIHRCLCQTVY